jgi:hypothetical protein
MKAYLKVLSLSSTSFCGDRILLGFIAIFFKFKVSLKDVGDKNNLTNFREKKNLIFSPKKCYSLASLGNPFFVS